MGYMPLGFRFSKEVECEIYVQSTWYVTTVVAETMVQAQQAQNLCRFQHKPKVTLPPTDCIALSMMEEPTKGAEKVVQGALGTATCMVEDDHRLGAMESSHVDMPLHHLDADGLPASKSDDASTKPESSVNSDLDPPVGDSLDAGTVAFMLTELAHQVEYYLSAQNLSRDTYVQTLRSLNDGCVPVSILANFAKVKGILLAAAGIVDEPSRQQAVCDAATNPYSSKLRVVRIDTQTGKQVPSCDGEEEDAERFRFNTILAIGTVDNEPIAVLDAQRPISSSEFANAIVMRDVAPHVTAEEIHDLFRYEGCPPVISITPDVAHCWFVELATTSRAEVMGVLLQLRCETLAGYPVHARIKTCVAASSIPIDPAPLMAPVHPLQTDQQPLQQGSKNKNGSNEQSRRKKKNKGKKRNDVNNGNKKSPSPVPTPRSSPVKSKDIVIPPPVLSEDNFPTLLDSRADWDTVSSIHEEKSSKESSTHSVIVEKNAKLEDDEEMELKSSKLLSDSVSVATTTSSSTEQPVPKKIGYAAAVKTATAVGSRNDGDSNDNNGLIPMMAGCPKKPTSPDTVTEIKEIEDVVSSNQVDIQPPIWGRGRSFADILRQPQTAS